MAADPHPDIPETDVHDTIIDALVTDEMGDTMAAAMREMRHSQEAWYRRQHPDEGLRERKRRLTRQLISDAATALFASRGFDEVKVSEVARRVGVSEKTIYNYFPNKEAMVLDTADEMVDNLAAALRDRAPGQTITDAVVEALIEDMAQFDAGGDALTEMIPAFVGMLQGTPSLHAAWLELHARVASVATEELAAEAGVDPRDPEPVAAGRALVGLMEVGTQSRLRHTQDGLRGSELNDAVIDDVRRAARMLDTGLWSFNVSAAGRARGQAAEAARAAEEARRQVVSALREAREAWEQARSVARDAGRQAREAARQAHAEAHAQERDARRAGAQSRRRER